MSTSIRLATFNILHGRSTLDGRVDLARFAAAVHELDPDVLALQEVDRAQPRSHDADLAGIAAAAMGAVAHRFVPTMSGLPADPWHPATGAESPDSPAYGIALLSRYPVTAWKVLPLPAVPVGLPIWYPDAPHPTESSEEPRSALLALLDTPAGPVTVVGTHLSFIPGWNDVQLRRLCRELSTVDSPLVIMGDLNMPAPRPADITGFRSLVSAPTVPAEAPVAQLDHILLRGQLGEPVEARAPVLPLSDHRALVVELDLGAAVVSGGDPGLVFDGDPARRHTAPTRQPLRSAMTTDG